MTPIQNYKARRKQRLIDRFYAATDPAEKAELGRTIWNVCFKNRLSNFDGGPGSGNHGHKGIPGKRGGSLPRSDRTIFSQRKSVTNQRPDSGTQAAKDHELKNSSPEAQAAYDKARASEVGITDDMCDIAEIVGAEMYGLPFSVKTASSVEDKIARKQEKDDSLTDEEVVASMGDLVRYTMMCDHDAIASTATGTMDAFAKNGYEVVEVDNKYTNPDAITYKGLHMSVVSPSGQKFELQVHSAESMKVKEENHVLYEEARKVGTSESRKAELDAQMIRNTSSLATPKGIDSIKSFKK